MVEVLIIVYSMLMWLVFKVFKVPLNKWTGTTAVLGGVVKIGDRITAGDVLFRIDPEPFQYEVDRLAAELILAESNLVDAEALLQKKFASPKDVERAQATVDSLTAPRLTLPCIPTVGSQWPSSGKLYWE